MTQAQQERREIITQDVLDAAFEWLLKSSDEIAAARANKIRKEFKARKVFARLFLTAPTGNVETRKMWATDHSEYEGAMEDVAIAEETWERCQDQRNRAELIIEAWRTQKASQRVIDRIR